MIEKTTTERILRRFFQNPTKQYHLRELSRELVLSMPTIIRSTDLLSKESLINKEKGKVITTVTAQRENATFIRLKRLYNLETIYCSGLIEYLNEVYTHPQAIILFGSYSRGEDIEKSDIDIAIITEKKKNQKVAKFEKYCLHTIAIHEVNLSKISDEFRANLANGIILEGSW